MIFKFFHIILIVIQHRAVGKGNGMTVRVYCAVVCKRAYFAVACKSPGAAALNFECRRYKKVSLTGRPDSHTQVFGLLLL